MTDLPEIDERLQKAIVEAVDAFWSENGRPMLLSSLGTKIKRSFSNTAELFPKGLKEFLREWPLVQLVEHPHVREKIGLVPNGVAIPEDKESLFPPSEKEKSESHTNSYIQIFWDAFFKPIQGQRFVAIESDGGINILDDPQQSTGKLYEIAPADLVQNDSSMTTPEKVKYTHERIATWLLKNNLQPTQFTKTHRFRSEFSGGKIAALRQAFSDLSQQDQSRIHIPLDIVMKLIS